ncbi:carotenoid oxygenase family protein [Yinghuangia aomiensis]
MTGDPAPGPHGGVHPQRSNPRSGTSGHWFLGDGMLHGVRFEEGRATWYRNRWVDTDRSGIHRPDGTRNLRSAAANTHVVRHARRLLALVESSFPYEITPDLGTVGPYDFAGRLGTPMTAPRRPTRSPASCTSSATRRCRRSSPTTARTRPGTWSTAGRSRVPRSTMMHDFQLTERHVLFFDLPVVFDMALVDQGTMPYRWDPSCGARIRRAAARRPGHARAVVRDRTLLHLPTPSPRTAPGTPWCSPRCASPTCPTRPAPRTPRSRGGGRSTWPAGTVRSEQLDDREAEFRAYRRPACGPWGTVRARSRQEHADPLRPGDRRRRRARLRPRPAPGRDGVRPVDRRRGQPGLLMGYVYDAASGTSDLVVHDAGTLEQVAAVHVPVRVPFGFHGDWFADPA